MSMNSENQALERAIELIAMREANLRAESICGKSSMGAWLGSLDADDRAVLQRYDDIVGRLSATVLQRQGMRVDAHMRELH